MLARGASGKYFKTSKYRRATLPLLICCRMLQNMTYKQPTRTRWLCRAARLTSDTRLGLLVRDYTSNYFLWKGKLGKTTQAWPRNAQPKMLWEPACPDSNYFHANVSRTKNHRFYYASHHTNENKSLSDPNKLCQSSCTNQIQHSAEEDESNVVKLTPVARGLSVLANMQTHMFQELRDLVLVVLVLLR